MGAEAAVFTRRRRIALALPGASSQQVAAYLALVERPLLALLARDRLQRQGNGQFRYHSRPVRLLQLELQPCLVLEARWRGALLQIRSSACRIEGLGAWGEQLGISLAAELAAEAPGLQGWAELSLRSRLLSWPRARQLATAALDLALERMERRVQRGLQRDLEAWLAHAGEPSGEAV